MLTFWFQPWSSLAWKSVRIAWPCLQDHEGGHRHGWRPQYLQLLWSAVSRPAADALADLRRGIDAGHPTLITLQAYRTSNRPYRELWDDGHWVAAIGYDRHRIYFEDPVRSTALGWPTKNFVNAGTTWIEANAFGSGAVPFSCVDGFNAATISTWTSASSEKFMPLIERLDTAKLAGIRRHRFLGRRTRTWDGRDQRLVKGRQMIPFGGSNQGETLS